MESDTHFEEAKRICPGPWCSKNPKQKRWVWYGVVWLHMVTWLHGYLRKPRTTSQKPCFSVEGNAGHVACGSLGHGLGISNVTWSKVVRKMVISLLNFNDLQKGEISMI